MTDLIEIRKIEDKILVTNIILENRSNEEILEYVKGRYSATMDYQGYGFEKPILGIGGKGFILPLDNSDKFFGRGDNGLIMICPNKSETELNGVSELFIMYDDEKFSEEKIHF